MALLVSIASYWEAHRSADVAERTLLAARPVVEVVGARALGPLTTESKPFLEIDLANHGQGIATDIRIVYLLHVGIPVIEFQSRSEYPPQWPMAPESLLAAGQTRKHQLPYFDAMPRLSANTAAYEGLYFYGFLSYTDAATGQIYDDVWCYGVVPSSEVLKNPNVLLASCRIGIKIRA